MFDDRTQAGSMLAQKLEKYKELPNTLILALPRGGLPVANIIAQHLHLPLDVIITRKIGHPYSEEFALGAISEYGSSVWGKDIEDVDPEWIDFEVKKENEEIKRRKKMYLGSRKRLGLEGKIVILVDDGAATGMTIIAALKDIKKMGANEIITVLPVLPKNTSEERNKSSAKLTSLQMPRDENFCGSVGAYYNDFSQVEDREVKTILRMNECKPK